MVSPSVVMQLRSALPRGLAAPPTGGALGNFPGLDRSLSGPGPSFVSRPIAPSAGPNSWPVTKRDRLPGGQVAAFSIRSSVSHPRPLLESACRRPAAGNLSIPSETLIFATLRPPRQCCSLTHQLVGGVLGEIRKEAGRGPHDGETGQQRCPSRSSTSTQFTPKHYAEASVPDPQQHKAETISMLDREGPPGLDDTMSRGISWL
jgi:hypothetical protein